MAANSSNRRHSILAHPSRIGLGAHDWMKIPSGTAAAAVRWPGDGVGSVNTTEAASPLVNALLSRVMRVVVPAAPGLDGTVDIRDKTGAAPARLTVQVLAAGVFPFVFDIAGGIGIMVPGNFSVVWTGAGTSPEIHVMYKNFDGEPLT